MQTKYLRRPAVSLRYSLPRSTLYDLIKKGHFPKPIHASGCSLWAVDELEAWEEARMVERDAQVVAGAARGGR